MRVSGSEGQGLDERLSVLQSGSGRGVGVGLGGGGEGFVGPTFTSVSVSLSSPVVTFPPVLPPVFASESVSLEMPPPEEVLGMWIGAGKGAGEGVTTVS